MSKAPKAPATQRPSSSWAVRTISSSMLLSGMLVLGTILGFIATIVMLLSSEYQTAALLGGLTLTGGFSILRCCHAEDVLLRDGQGYVKEMDALYVQIAQDAKRFSSQEWAKIRPALRAQHAELLRHAYLQADAGRELLRHTESTQHLEESSLSHMHALGYSHPEYDRLVGEMRTANSQMATIISETRELAQSYRQLVGPRSETTPGVGRRDCGIESHIRRVEAMCEGMHEVRALEPHYTHEAPARQVNTH